MADRAETHASLGLTVETARRYPTTVVSAGREPPIRRETMVRAHRRMGRETADDNETFRRAGHCNRPTMRLLGSSRWRTRTGVSLLPRAHRLRAERGTRGIARTRDREKEGGGGSSLLLSVRPFRLARARRDVSAVNERNASDDETRGKAGRTRRVRPRRVDEGERRRDRENRCGYGYVATPRGASQRALRRPTTHLTSQWADPRSYARWLCIVPPLCELSGTHAAKMKRKYAGQVRCGQEIRMRDPE